MTPKEFVDGVSGEIKRIWDLMNTSYDKFIRTTDADHEKQVQKIFKKLYDKGDIYKGILLYGITAGRRQVSGLRTSRTACKGRSLFL